MELKISAKRVLTLLATLAGVLIIFHYIVNYLHLVQGHEYVFGFVNFLNLNNEYNLPTCFSAVILAISATLFLTEAVLSSHQNEESNTWAWALLAIIFGILTVDELTQLHEQISIQLESMITFEGHFRYAWVIPYGGFVLLFVLFYGRFWWKLPSKTRVLIAIAFLFYVGGALGVEMLSADFAHYNEYVGVNLINSPVAQKYHFVYAVAEEGLEMAGIIILIYALLDDLSKKKPSITFHS